MSTAVTVHLDARSGHAETVARMALTSGQLTGWDCITCGNTQVPGRPFVPVGYAAGHGQVFTCASHH